MNPPGLWLSSLPPQTLTPRPALPGDNDCDAAIVGAGMTGLWTAYSLKRLAPDMRIIVLESEVAGFGASGRNGGWASTGIAGSPRVYARRGGGRDALVRATRATVDALDQIEATVEREQIDCGYVRAGMLRVATSPAQVQRLLAAFGAQQDAGVLLPETSVRSDPAPAEVAPVDGGLASVFAPDAARVDPARLVRGLAEACERLGVTIHEQSRALTVEPRRVRCAAGTVRAEIVLRATEAFTTQLPGLARRYLPLYSLMIATEPLPSEVWDELGWPDGLLVGDLHHHFFYAQRTTDGRIAIGGRGAPYRIGRPFDPRNETNDGVRARLAAAVRTHFPAAAEARITHHWGGALAVPRDWSMGIGFERATGFGWAGGYSGHGVVAANLSGRTLADLVLDRRTDLVTLPWVGHESRSWEPEPLRFLASGAIVRTLAGADRVEDTGRRARRTRLVAPFMPPG